MTYPPLKRSTSNRTDIMDISKYYTASTSGFEGKESLVRSGRVPRLYGIPLYTTTQVVTTDTTYVHNLLLQKEAFAFAQAQGIRTQSTYKQENLGTLTTCDIIFGVAENRDAAAVHVKSQA